MIWIACVVAAIGVTYWVHRTTGAERRWFWIGLAFLAGWTLFLATVPGGSSFSGPWIILDAPLNFGWMLAWSWPWLRTIPDDWRRTAARFRETRRLLSEARAARH